MHHPPGVGVFASLEALQTLYCWDFMEAASHRHDQLTPFPLPSPLENGDRAENSKLLIMVWSFW